MLKIFIDMDGTIAKFNSKRNALNRYATERYFFTTLKPYAGINVINEMAAAGNIHIISVSPNLYADLDKKSWLHRYCPNVKSNNIIFIPEGKNKAHAAEQKLHLCMKKDWILLDDYTPNLEAWEECGGTGIKRLTSLADNSTGKWQGATLKDLRNLAEVIKKIIRLT